FTETKHSKIFDTEEFGYYKITVERPLRLNFQASEERIARLDEQSAFARLATTRKKGEVGEREVEEGRALQEAIRSALRRIDPDVVYKSRPEFRKVLKRTLGEEGVLLTAPLEKAILAALSER